MKKTWVLAFDIERTGSTDKHETIAIGAAVVDENFKLLDSLFLPGYTPRMFPEDGSAPEGFEKRCWDEFWVHNKEKLVLFEYPQSQLWGASRPRAAIENEMINRFQEFRRIWEERARAQGAHLELCSDNNVFDGGFVNELIFCYHPDQLPIPYTASQQRYGAFWETHSMLRGILAIADPSFDSNWGFSKRIREVYEVPSGEPIEHDHMPQNDAYAIAYDAQIVLGIRDGRLKKKAKTSE